MPQLQATLPVQICLRVLSVSAGKSAAEHFLGEKSEDFTMGTLEHQKNKTVGRTIGTGTCKFVSVWGWNHFLSFITIVGGMLMASFAMMTPKLIAGFPSSVSLALPMLSFVITKTIIPYRCSNCYFHLHYVHHLHSCHIRLCGMIWPPVVFINHKNR